MAASLPHRHTDPVGARSGLKSKQKIPTGIHRLDADDPLLRPDCLMIF
jgi:hypothetical protein